MPGDPPPAAGLARLDDLLLHRLRLGACVLLAQADRLSFRQLRDDLEATDGNLGAQLRKLETAGYVTVAKEFRDRKPISRYRLTGAGKKALRRHLDALGNLADSLR